VKIHRDDAADIFERLRHLLIDQQREQRAADAKSETGGREERTVPGLDTTFPAGTILSCVGCEEGLYKVSARVMTEDLELDDGTILKPFNVAIPPRDVWKPLVCSQCGGRVYKDGKLHTVQAGRK
jgi:hypothetical protein